MAHIGNNLLTLLKQHKWYHLFTVQALFILGFQLFGIQSVYLLIALALGVFFLIKDYASFDDYQRTDLGLMMTSLTIFTLFISVSPLYLESGSWLRNGLLALGFSATYFLGFIAVKKYKFSYEVIIKTLLLGLSLFVLINVLYTLFRYLPFYRLFFSGQVIYVNGEVYVVSEEVKWLVGLSFKEVTVDYMAFYLTLLLTPWLSQIHTLKTLKIKQWRLHVWWLLPTSVGLLGVIFLPVLSPLLISLFLAGLIYISPKVPKLYQTYQTFLKPVLYGLLGFIALMVTLFFIDAYDLFGIGTLVKQIGPLRIILDYPLIEGYQEVLRSFVNYPFGGFAPIIVSGQYLTTTYSFFFDTIHQAGIFALLGLSLIGVFFTIQLIAFSKNQSVNIAIRMTLVWLVTMFMVYQLFQTQLYPFIREDIKFTPRLILDEPLWMVMVFLMGTIMIDPFVGFLAMDKSKQKTKTKTIPTKKVVLPVKKLKKETTLRKEKSPSVFADRWKVLD
jgi:hypothetical protein